MHCAQLEVIKNGMIFNGTIEQLRMQGMQGMARLPPQTSGTCWFALAKEVAGGVREP